MDSQFIIRTIEMSACVIVLCICFNKMSKGRTNTIYGN